MAHLMRIVCMFVLFCCVYGVKITRVGSSPDEFTSRACSSSACNTRSAYCAGQCCSCICYTGNTYLTQSDSCQQRSSFMLETGCSLSFAAKDNLQTISFDELKSGKPFHYCGSDSGSQQCRDLAKGCTINKVGSEFENNGWKSVWGNNEAVDIAAAHPGTKEGFLRFTGSECSNAKYRGVLMRLALTCTVNVFNATFRGPLSISTCLWLSISGEFQDGASSLKERETCGVTQPTTCPSTSTPSQGGSTAPTTTPVSTTEAVGGSQSPSENKDMASDVPIGMIVGISAAVVVVGLIAVLMIWLFCGSSKRLKHNRSVILHPNESDIGYNKNLSEVNRGFRGTNISRLFSPNVNEMFTIQGKARPLSDDGDHIYDAPCDSEDATPHDLNDMYAVVDKSPSNFSTFGRGHKNRRSSSPATSSSMYDEPGTIISSSRSDLNLSPYQLPLDDDNDDVYDRPESIHVTIPSRDYATPDDALPKRSNRYEDEVIYHEPETG